jgi:hypothetical protein
MVLLANPLRDVVGRSLAVASLSSLMALACASPGHESAFGDGGVDASSGGSSDSSGGLMLGNDSSITGDSGAGPCTGSGCACTGNGWNCKIAPCDGGTKTTVTAKVYDPAGKVPLYDVAVYVPNSTVLPITTGPTCDNCATPVSGDPVASALTDPTGQFVMKDVPVGTNVPLVIQIGKWRRQVVMPEIKACQNNVFDDPTTFRLPQNQSEGNLPKIALAVGGADSLECMLRRVGVSDSEFTNPTGSGRINLFTNDFVGSASVDTAVTAYASGDTFPLLSPLFASVNAIADGGLEDAGIDPLSNYDIAIISCQGSQAAGRAVSSADKQGLKAFVDHGGRAFLSHYNYSWLRGGGVVGSKDPNPSPEGSAIDLQTKYAETPFPPIAVWEDPTALTYAPGGDGTYSIDTSFPKGSDMSMWLSSVGASTTPGSIDLVNVKNPATSVIAAVAQRWIYDDTMGTPYISANTPIEEATTPDQQCGRIVHTGIHVATVAGDTIAPFPTGCVSAPLKPQEEAMEFLLFDLSSCVSNEKVAPTPPTTIPR